MIKLSYYIMAVEFANQIGMTGALYDDGKFVLSGDRPIFNGDTIDLSDKTDEDLDELLAIIETMRAQEPKGDLLIIPRWFGLHLYTNHPAFKPKETSNP